MIYKRFIPCLDLKDGRVVKDVQFSDIRDAGDPVECAIRYQQQGADEISLLDISATPEAKCTCYKTISAIRKELSIPITAGGGLRSVEDARALLLAGADKVVVNSAAVARPELIQELAKAFGKQCVVLALDAIRKDSCWKAMTQSGAKQEKLCALAWAKQAADLGAGEILLTSFDRDGTGEGYDLDLIAAIRQQVSVPIIASGGARTAKHLSEAIDAGADALLAASILHDSITTIGQLKTELKQLGKRVRPC